jgi:hypothetical protein
MPIEFPNTLTSTNLLVLLHVSHTRPSPFRVTRVIMVCLILLCFTNILQYVVNIPFTSGSKGCQMLQPMRFNWTLLSCVYSAICVAYSTMDLQSVI